MKLPKPKVGDFWGGLAAMLVALPSAIAFGVTIYSSLGSAFVAQGALAGILGATALGLISPVLGGTNRLITAPCAPAAAVLSAFAVEFMLGGGSVQSVLLMMSMLGLFAGMLQILFGIVRLGHLIKYMPYPVVSGYLSGVGLYIISGQMPKFLGAPKGSHFWESLVAPEFWKWQSIVIGVVTIAMMILAPRITKAIPAAILALLAGVFTYFGLGIIDPTLYTLEGNLFVVGPLGAGSDTGFIDAMSVRWYMISDVDVDQIIHITLPALTLAVLLSIDTLKTCVVLDALTRSRHNSNRELIGQGIGNVASSLIGGLPGAGTIGATLVNISSGAVSRYSGFFEGILALVAFLILGVFISWIPVAALAAILMAIGVRMIDRHSFQFLKQRSTILDFFVVVAVITTALTVSLIAASGVGISLAVFLFIREQIGGSVIRRKLCCNETFSKRLRTHDEIEILAVHGGRGMVVELQGSLFFGTTNQLYLALEEELKTRDFLILDMRRVQSIDITAAHLLDQLRDMMADKNGFLIYSDLPTNLLSGQDIYQYFEQVGLAPQKSAARVFDDIDGAKEWVENRILKEADFHQEEGHRLHIKEFDLFKGRKEETLAVFETHLVKISYSAGTKILSRGDTGDDLFFIRKGLISFVLPIDGNHVRRLSTCGRGAFFGEMTFLDGSARSADVIAISDVDLFVLSRKTFDTFSEEHKNVALNLFEGMATVLTRRVRHLTAELIASQS
ncbi:MAG: SulP family inorganic anion transporter [Methylococcales bacterium]|nr:SulP family inorganic anion transporter [Methylococcales bacterium]